MEKELYEIQRHHRGSSHARHEGPAAALRDIKREMRDRSRGMSSSPERKGSAPGGRERSQQRRKDGLSKETQAFLDRIAKLEEERYLLQVENE